MGTTSPYGSRCTDVPERRRGSRGKREALYGRLSGSPRSGSERPRSRLCKLVQRGPESFAAFWCRGATGPRDLKQPRELLYGARAPYIGESSSFLARNRRRANRREKALSAV